jgi:hypothetical protein
VTLLRRSFLRRVLTCTLALLVPAHGTATSIASTIGPSHVHRIVTGAALVLDDARRVVPTATEIRFDGPCPSETRVRTCRARTA